MNDDNGKKTVKEIDCTEAIGGLYAYLDGEIDDMDAIARLEHHLEHCHTCFTRSEVESMITSRIREASERHAPESLQNRLRNMIEKF